mgnify:CR=1 FL=1
MLRNQYTTVQRDGYPVYCSEKASTTLQRGRYKKIGLQLILGDLLNFGLQFFYKMGAKWHMQDFQMDRMEKEIEFNHGDLLGAPTAAFTHLRLRASR